MCDYIIYNHTFNVRAKNTYIICFMIIIFYLFNKLLISWKSFLINLKAIIKINDHRLSITLINRLIKEVFQKNI